MGKYLDFYKKCCEDNFQLPLTRNNVRIMGLCLALEEHAGDDFFCSPVDDFAPIDGSGGIFWAGPRGKFNPLRQNIVLFLAAMNDEL